MKTLRILITVFLCLTTFPSSKVVFGQTVPDFTSGLIYEPTGSRNLIWTPSKVYMQSSINYNFNALEVTENGNAVGGVQGMVYEPSGSRALIWNNSKIYMLSSI